MRALFAMGQLLTKKSVTVGGKSSPLLSHEEVLTSETQVPVSLEGPGWIKP